MSDYFDLDWRYCTVEDIFHLVDQNVCINAVDEMGLTPLMYAVMHNDCVDVVEMLIKKGADVNAKDNLGRTALLLACQYNDLPVVQILSKNGANIYIQDNEGKSALWYSMHHRAGERLDILAYLLGENFCFGCCDCIPVLQKFQGDLKSVDEDGKTALLNLLRLKERFAGDQTTMAEVVDKFRLFGADANAQDKFGNTIITSMVKESPYEGDTNYFNLHAFEIYLDTDSDIPF